MDSWRSRWTSPSFLDRAAMPFTPKQLVATAPVMVVKNLAADLDLASVIL